MPGEKFLDGRQSLKVIKIGQKANVPKADENTKDTTKLKGRLPGLHSQKPSQHPVRKPHRARHPLAQVSYAPPPSPQGVNMTATEFPSLSKPANNGGYAAVVRKSSAPASESDYGDHVSNQGASEQTHTQSTQMTRNLIPGISPFPPRGIISNPQLVASVDEYVRSRSASPALARASTNAGFRHGYHDSLDPSPSFSNQGSDNYSPRSGSPVHFPEDFVQFRRAASPAPGFKFVDPRAPSPVDLFTGSNPMFESEDYLRFRADRETQWEGNGYGVGNSYMAPGFNMDNATPRGRPAERRNGPGGF